MPSYIGLNSRQTTATADDTGLNPGNWTNDFGTDLMPSIAQYEIYHAVVTGAPAGATATITIGTRQISFTAPGFGGGSEWDPAQPPIVMEGQEVYFLWNVAATGTPPVVTLWLRYDPAVPNNPVVQGRLL